MKTKRDLAQVLREKDVLVHTREKIYIGLVGTTKELEQLGKQKQVLFAKLEFERRRIESLALDCYQVDEHLFSSSSADADYLLLDLADRIETIQRLVSSVDLEATELREQRLEYQRQFLAAEAKLAKIVAEIREFFP